MQAATTIAAESPVAVRPREKSLPRWIVLIAALGVVGLSMSLSLKDSGGQVIVPLINTPLPPLCTLKRLTGLDCPGCGLTRSFVALGHGQWREAVRWNPAGPIWFAFIALQVPYQAWQLRLLSRGQRPLDLTWWGQGLIYVGLAGLILQWVVRQFGWL